MVLTKLRTLDLPRDFQVHLGASPCTRALGTAVRVAQTNAPLTISHRRWGGFRFVIRRCRYTLRGVVVRLKLAFRKFYLRAIRSSCVRLVASVGCTIFSLLAWFAHHIIPPFRSAWGALWNCCGVFAALWKRRKRPVLDDDDFELPLVSDSRWRINPRSGRPWVNYKLAGEESWCDDWAPVGTAGEDGDESDLGFVACPEDNEYMWNELD
jgi:hypothetical protein